MWQAIIVLAVFTLEAVYGQVTDDQIEFYLTNSRATNERLFTNEYGNNIINTAPVKFLLHGWTQNLDSNWYPAATEPYVSLGYNVISVDWSRHSRLPYSLSVSRLSEIGAVIARFIIGLSNQRGIPLDRFHLVGHSLGAHLSGFTGKHIQSQTGTRLGRITGLDPAGPLFLYAGSSGRLNEEDANHVDTILTDSGIAGLGINRSLGQVNFFPNGGTASQPGCLIVTCSHNHAPRLFAEGILSNDFVSHECSNWTGYRLGFCSGNPQNLLGENVDFSNTGDFYLRTNRRSPFAQG